MDPDQHRCYRESAKVKVAEEQRDKINTFRKEGGTFLEACLPDLGCTACGT